MSKQILLIEDDPDLAELISDYLTMNYYDVHHAGLGQEGLDLLDTKERDIDLVVLDLMLPDMDGMQVCQKISGNKNNMTNKVPIIMLTAKGDTTDRVLGLEMGADDYLVKPFALPELWSRIQAVLKRSQKQQVRLLQVADVRLDLDLRQARRQQQLLHLNPKCLKLLEILMRNAPHVVSRETLVDQLWADDPPDSDGLKSHIYLLRNQLDKPFSQPLLQTVHGQGYRLAVSE